MRLSKETIKILCVEDEASTAKILVTSLKKSGYENITVVETGIDACEFVKKASPHIIIMDITLKGDMDGIETVEEIQKFADIPVIFMTGSLDETHLARAQKTNPYHYLVKPYKLYELLFSLENSLKRHYLEKRLKSSEKRYRSIFNQSNEIIILYSMKGTIVTANKKASDVLNSEKDTLKDQNLSTFIRPESIEDYNWFNKRVTTKGVAKRVIRLKNHGNDFEEVEFSGVLLEKGKGIIQVIGRDVGRYRSVERSLRKNLEFMQILIDTIPYPVFVKDRDGVYVSCNSMFAQEVLGSTPEEVHGKKVFDFPETVSKKMAEKAHTSDMALIRNPGTRKYEGLVQTSQGAVRNYLISKATYPDEQGEVAGLVGVLVDIDDRIRAEEAIRNSQEQLNLIMQSVITGILLVDAEDMTIVEVNTEASKITGYSRDELLKSVSYEELCPSSMEILDTLEESAYTGYWTSDIITIDKRELPVYKNISKVFFDGKEYLVDSFIDVSKQKEAEEQLASKSREQEALLSSIVALIIGVSARDEITLWNRTAETIFGVSADDIIGERFLLSGIDWDWNRLYEGISDCIYKEEPIKINDFIYTSKDDHQGFLNLTVNPVKDSIGDLMGFILYGEEITEHKLLEAQLGQAQKLESMGQLAAGIAHEINTPTQYITDNTHFLKDSFNDLNGYVEGSLSLLKEADKCCPEVMLGEKVSKMEEALEYDYLSEEIPKAIDQSLQGLKHVANIVHSMKQFAHPGTTDKVRVNINTLINDSITISRNEWKYVADIDTNLYESLPDIKCYANELNQVFLNLIVNAAQAIESHLGESGEERGKIIISTKLATKKDNKKYIYIKIEDTGGGIPDDVQDRIFDPFFTTKEVGKGTGQGLAIAFSVITQKHDGIISVSSEEGKGATFTIHLPLDDEGEER